MMDWATRAVPTANEKEVRMIKAIVSFLAFAGVLILAIVGAYWWSNVPPRRPNGVSSKAVFLWAGHLGLPAPKHGTWIECWADTGNGANECRLTEMDGTLEYEGVFLANTGKTPVPSADLKIVSEQTSQSTDLWVRVNEHFIPLVFLRDGTVLIPKGRYQEGKAKLEHLRQVKENKP
jgi:hypothetical protein